MGDVGRKPKERKAPRCGLTQRSKAVPDPRGAGGQDWVAGDGGGPKDSETEEVATLGTGGTGLGN